MGEIHLAEDGLVFSDNLLSAQAELNSATQEGATGLRAPSNGAIQLASSPDKTRTAIAEVFLGKAISDVETFKDTPLASIPPDSGLPLLAHLWCTNEIGLLSSFVAQKIHGGEGVVLIPHPFLVTQTEAMKPYTNQIFNTLFWSKNWYESLREDELTNAILERPLLRCDAGGGRFYATSPLLVYDALAWGIESAFFKYPRMAALHLPDVAFQKAFSDPFEESVIQLCRSAGMLAGRVTESGMWQNQYGNESIRGVGSEICPGEIDCLALLEDRSQAFIFECKVLRLSQNYSILRNIISKLSDADSESFHSKLAKKTLWIQNVLGIEDIHPGVVLDRPIPLQMDTRHPILQLSQLNNFFQIKRI